MILRAFITAFRAFVARHVSYSEGTHACPLCADVYDHEHDCRPTIRLRAYCVDCDEVRLVDRFGACSCGSRSTKQVGLMVLERLV